jgi:threonine/homoserine/homoserine lactone efflux protein
VAELAAFLAVALVVICTPGPDTAVTVRNSLLGSRQAGIFTALGVSTGQLVWTLAASVGIAALLVASEPAFQALKLAGAAYLIWLGVQTLWGVVRRRSREPDSGRRRALSPRQAWRQGVLSNLGNPKSAAFFTSLLPQFGTTDAGPSFWLMLVFGLLFALMTWLWLVLYATAIQRLGDALRSSRVRRSIEAVTGTVLVGLGLRLATEQHRV